MSTILATVLATLAAIAVICQVLFNAFIYWKLFNREQTELKLLGWIQAADKMILRLLRTLTPDQARKFRNTICADCAEILDENVVRQADGVYLCADCKIKRANKVIFPS